MISERVDLTIALKELHGLGLRNGDLGYAYFYKISELLKRADGMQAEIEALQQELARCRENKRSSLRRKTKLF